MVLDVILVFLGVVLVVLEVTGPPVTGSHCLVADTGRINDFHCYWDLPFGSVAASSTGGERLPNSTNRTTRRVVLVILFVGLVVLEVVLEVILVFLGVVLVVLEVALV